VVLVDGGNNETLIDSYTYSVEACTRHNVQASWSAQKEYVVFVLRIFFCAQHNK
jgi:hypothetical protein